MLFRSRLMGSAGVPDPRILTPVRYEETGRAAAAGNENLEPIDYTAALERMAAIKGKEGI